MLKNSIKLWHPATEPISTSELYKVLAGENFENKILDEPLKKETFLYLIFGILTTIVNIVSFFVFNKLFNYKLSNIIAFILAIVFAYIMNKMYVFESKRKEKLETIKEFIFFIGSRLFTFITDMILIVLFINILISKIIVSIIVIILNYILSKKLVFRK